MKTWRIVQHIYENAESVPTLTHVFYGETRERAAEVYKAHMGTDAFMSGCTLQGRFRDFRCHSASHVERVNMRGEWVSAGVFEG